MQFTCINLLMKLGSVLLPLFLLVSGQEMTVFGQATNAAESAAISTGPYLPVAKTDAWWVARHAELVHRAKAGPAPLLFLGDSIMQGWNCRLMLGKPEGAHDGAGRDLWDKLYAPRNAADQSVGGDGIQHLLWRITDGGEIDGLAPKVIVLLIGTNNLGGKDSPERVAEGVGQVVGVLQSRVPNAKILVLGIFPRGEKASDPFRAKIAATNQFIAKLDDEKQVHFLDFGSQFLQPDGTISKDIMPDFLHPSAKGYAIWARAMQPTLDQLWK